MPGEFASLCLCAEQVLCPQASGLPRALPCAADGQRHDGYTQETGGLMTHMMYRQLCAGRVRKFVLRRRAGFVPPGLGITPSAPCAASVSGVGLVKHITVES